VACFPDTIDFVRADRLVAILLLLQRRGQVTASEVAGELEVSVRTARRDLEALSMAGVPVYSERGRGGGWRLLGSGKTDLSGLTATEARALFLVAGTAAEVTPDIRAALRKLVRALPETMRTEAETASRSVVVDPGGWGRAPRPPRRPDHLDELQAATVAEAQICLGYRDRDGASTTRVVDPLGLAQKGRVWYLIAGTDKGQRTFRVARVTSVERTGRPATRPPGFDLAESWRGVVERVDELRSPVELEVLVRDPHVQTLRWMFDDQAIVGDTAPDGRTAMRIRGQHVDVLAAQVAGFGRDVEVVGPEEARRFLASLAGELREVYEERPPPVPYIERAGPSSSRMFST
jgi:predicted DNA-binding transcriptional regulator YafY